VARRVLAEWCALGKTGSNCLPLGMRRRFYFLPIGIAIGAGIGVAMKNVAMGVAIGAALGIAFSVIRRD